MLMTFSNPEKSLQKSSFTNFSLTSWPIVLGVLEFLLRRAQHVINELNIDEDDFELDGPISRDKENDPFELILMGYKTWMSKIDTSDGSNFEEIQPGYQNTLRCDLKWIIKNSSLGVAVLFCGQNRVVL